MSDKPEKQLSETEPSEPEVSENALKRGLRGVRSGASAAGSALEDVGDRLKEKQGDYATYIGAATSAASIVARLHPAISVASALLPFVPRVIKGTGTSIIHLKHLAEDPKKESKVISNGVKSKFNSVKKWGRNAKQESDRKDQEFRDLDVDAPSDAE